jgi:hypothetical protein
LCYYTVVLCWVWKRFTMCRLRNTHLRRHQQLVFVYFDWHHSLWHHLESVLQGSAQYVRVHLQPGSHFARLHQLQCIIESVIVLWNAVSKFEFDLL